MKFRVEHVFTGVGIADYENLYFDEAFNTALCEAVKLTRSLKKRDLVAGKLTRIVRIGAEREIPGPVAKIIGANKLEYTEYIDYAWGSNRGTWRTESAILTDKIESGGQFGFEKRKDGVLRWVEGEIKVKIFGLGSVVERFIVADVEKSYEQAAEFTKRYLASGKAKKT
jgi:hypothetical protein